MKKIIKSGISILLCAVMMFGAAPLSGFKDINLSGAFGKIADWIDSLKLSTSASAASTLAPTGQCGKNVYWTFDEETGTLTISGTGDMLYSSSPFRDNRNIKEVIITNGVTSIGTWAFWYCTNLTSIEIPNSVTCISGSAFEDCTSLTSVTIPDSVTSIKDNAFSHCTSLASIEIPDSVTSIGDSAFYWCTQLTGICIPNVTVIGKRAFYGCAELKNVTTGNALENIGDNAFQNCINLTSVINLSNITSIGNYVFYGCTELKNVTTGSALENIGDYAFYNCINLTSAINSSNLKNIGSYAFYGCTELKNVTTGDVLENIGDYAFYNCINLTSAMNSSNLTNIGSYAFYGCSGLTSLDIPDSVKSIGDEAFYNCENLTNITIDNAVISMGELIFYNTGYYNNASNWENSVLYIGKNLIKAKTSVRGVYVVKTNTKTIAKAAFYKCTGLTGITIPDGLTSAGNYAFAGCTALTNITIPNGVTSISDHTFDGCTGLTSIIIPNGIASINVAAFSNCTGLKSVIIPDSVTYIGASAFFKCTGISNLTIPTSVKEIGGSNAFSNVENIIYSTAWYKNTMKSTGSPWGAKSANAYVENGLIFNNTTKTKLIGVCNSFSGESIVIPNSVTSIEKKAFYNCNSLKSITIPNSVITIGTEAFEKCTGLTGITIPDSVTSIGSMAFYNCTNLTSVELPDSITNISSGLFYKCTNLSSIKIPNSVTYIDDGAFEYCTNLTSIIIPDSVTSIADHAFEYCENLTSITIGNNVASIGQYAFEGCRKAKTINISSIETWCNIEMGTGNADLGFNEVNMYLNSEPLTELIIPDGIESIRSFAFENCQNITSVIIPDSVTSIGSSAFEYCRNLSEILIGNGVTSIGWHAFYWCSGLTSLTIPTSVTYIEELAFSGVNNIIYSDNWYNDVMHRQGSPWGARAVDAYVENGLYYYDSSKELLLACSLDASGTVDIPETVEEVGENCFLGCDNIETLNFSSPVYFADTALSGCDNLQNVIADANTDDFGVVYTKPVTNGGISTASVSGSSISIEYDTGILFCKRNASGDYTVPSKITHICENAFANCNNVSVIIPDGVVLKRIGANAFLNSKDYNDSAKWLNNVLVIGNYIVASKAELSGIYTVASAIKGVADRAFAGCSGMTGFNCGSGTRFLGSGVFNGCSSSLKDNLTFSSTESLEYIGGDIFDAENEKDYVKETTYCNNALISVSPDVENFTIEDGTTIIAEGAFEGCTNLKSITIPDSIKKINKDTFKGCISLSSVTLNANINEIGDNAFADCMSLTEISIPASVKEIGHLAFYGCTGMRSFNVASGNEKYKSDDGILMSADGNTVIQYPAAKDGTEYSITSGKSVCDFAFYRCRNLQKITLADNVTLGNRNPFASCTADFNNGKYVFGDAKKTILKSVSASVTGEFTVPYTVKEIGSDALRECTGITAVDFSNAYYLKKIGDNAFYGCTGLTDIIVPNTVTDIGTSAFENCLNLKTVEFTADKNSDINTKLVSIGDYAFCNCPCNATDGSCNSDILSAEKLEIGKNAFNNVFCDSVKLDSRGLIYGFNSGLDSLNSLINIDDDNVTVSCNTKTIGTGSVVTVTNGSEKSSYYNVVIFGDVNGDGWYDGMDAIMVSCLANGMLTKEDVSEAVYTAADCNHDGVINDADVELLQQAGVLLANVDQTKSKEELLETSSAYVEYLNLIDQTVEEDSAEITDVAPTPETAKILFDILKETVIKIINYIILNLSILKLR